MMNRRKFRKGRFKKPAHSDTSKPKKPSIEKQTPPKAKIKVYGDPIPPAKLGIIFFETFQQATNSTTELTQAMEEVDKLSICIKQEGNMEDPILSEYGKVYAGTAWYEIHGRRVEESWYNEVKNFADS